MDHELSPTQTLLKSTASDFFAREFPLDRIREFRKDPDPAERGLWKAIAGLGWGAAPFDEATGGFPGSFLEAAVLLEEMGWACAPSPFVHSVIAAGLPLAGRHDGLIGDVASGEAVVVPVPVAPGRPLAQREGDTASGTFLGVPWTDLATHYLLPGGDGCLLVEAQATGVSSKRLDSPGIESVGALEVKSAAVAASYDARFVGEVT
ncbi:MAG: acyl-CoA dehydrogenase family protein, partial [Dehalococcoidia bacterium]